MNKSDIIQIRSHLSSLDASVSHGASGETKPRIEEIFTPQHHAGALDPNVTIVLGARGVGKSFWAGVLGNIDTRLAAADAYPHLGLDKLEVKFGFTGILNDGSVSRNTIDELIPLGEEDLRGPILWRCIILRNIQSALDENLPPKKMKQMMSEYSDSEDFEIECAKLNGKLAQENKTALVIFDALDSLSTNWDRMRRLLDTLLETAWSLRGYKSLKIKLFLRPDQMRTLSLKFVELPKMIAGATQLNWKDTDLYGMFFSRLGQLSSMDFKHSFSTLLQSQSIPNPPTDLKQLRTWTLAYDRQAQSKFFTLLAGPYMGKSSKKGRTYEWPLRHLADGKDEVTPRSFLSLMISAARTTQNTDENCLSPEGIRHGLREASRVRVDQLKLEFPWVPRVLAPLASMQVPCTDKDIILRWSTSQTLESILHYAKSENFLSPLRTNESSPDTAAKELINELIHIGVLRKRDDDRYDMPDIFRVAAKLLRKGGVAPTN